MESHGLLGETKQSLEGSTTATEAARTEGGWFAPPGPPAAGGRHARVREPRVRAVHGATVAPLRHDALRAEGAARPPHAAADGERPRGE